MFSNFYSISGNTPKSVWPLIFIYIGLAVLLIFVKLFLKHLDNRKIQSMAQISLNVTVVNKEQKIISTKLGIKTMFLVTFQSSEGLIKEFDIDIAVFDSIKIGDFGMLTFKEQDETRIFVSFKPERSLPL